MRIGKTGCHEESEVIIIIHVLISNLDELASSLDNDLLLKDWIKHWVNLVFDGLNEAWETFLEWPFQGVLEIWVTQGDDSVLDEEVWLSSSDPVNSLSLRIDHEWVSGRSGDHDTVLDGEVI